MASSKQVEKEHNNFCRYSRLLLEVAPLVLRKLLETRALSQHNVSTIDDVLADTTISNKLKQYLVKIKVLRQHQLDLLYPPGGGSVNIKDWDITLLCVLLKNICTISPQEMTNVEQIRNIRNSTYGHIAGASLSNQDYTIYWADLSSAINDIVKAINDQAFLKETNDFVSFIKHERETDLLDEIVKTWKKDEDYFVLTQACKNVQQQLERSNIVTITGVSGSGKSGIAHHIALTLGTEGYTIYPVDHADDIEKYGEINSKQVFVLDDPVGKHEVDWNELRQFEKIHKTITSLTTRDVKLILTCRKNIVNDEKFLSYKTIVGMGLVDLSSVENHLIEGEKKSILDKYAYKANISATDIENIVNKSYQNFPLLCKVFGANVAEFANQPIKYFSEPFSVLLEELNTIKQRDLYQYFSLILCLIFQNSFDVKCLNARSEIFKTSNKILSEVMSMCGLSKDEPPNKIEHAFNTLVGVYFIQEDTRFRFIHDTLFDVVAYQFGTDYPCEMLKYCSSSFIREHVRTEGVDTDDDLVIRIKEEQYEELIKRLYSDLGDGDFHDVFLNPSLSDIPFVKAFCKHTTKMKTDDLLNVYFRSEQNLKKYQSAGLTSEKRWGKHWLILNLLDDENTRAIDWVMSHDMFEIFRACHCAVKTFQNVHKKRKLSRLKSVVTRKSGHERYDENNLIPMACLSGNVNMLAILLHDNFRIGKASVWGSIENWNWNALHLAAISGNIDMVRKVISNPIDIDSCVHGNGYTSLFLSSALGYTNICRYLQQNGADINLCDSGGGSPVYVAAQEGHTVTVSVLLQNGAEINRCDNDGASALYIAAFNGHSDTVSVLLQNGAEINRCHINGASPLYVAAVNGHSNTVSVLLHAGADINRCASDGASPLYVAAHEGRTVTVSVLLQGGADINRCNNNGCSPLYTASFNGHSNTVSVLLHDGADINRCDSVGASPLYVAAQEGRTVTVSVLLQGGADINRCHSDGRSPLYAAAQNGHSDTVSVMLQNGADINRCHSDSVSALYVAAQEGHSDTVSVMLQNGADINRCDSDGFSPLYIAAQEGRTVTVSVLLQGGADINRCHSDGRSPLYAAAQNGHSDTVSVMLQNGADINRCDSDGFSPLYIAAQEGHTVTVSVLLQNGADINRCNNNGFSPLYVATQEGHSDTVSVLLQNGADINRCHSDGRSPLYVAAHGGRTDTVSVLLQNGADINRCHSHDRSPLYVAAQEGRTDTVSVLLHNGADINRCHSDGFSPLYIASFNGHADTVSVLLQNGADINRCDSDGFSPLYVAAGEGRTDTVSVLLQGGADLNRCHSGSFSPLYAAAHNGHSDTVSVLFQNGADINRCKHGGFSPLFAAAAEGHTGTVSVLLQNGADVNLCNSTGTSPMHIAAEKGHLAIVQALVDAGADVNIVDKNGSSAAALARAEDHDNIVQLLSALQVVDTSNT